MTPLEWYQSRRSHWAGRREEAERRALVISRLRLLTFFAAAVLLWWGIRNVSIVAIAAGSAAVVGFIVLVVVHARQIDAGEQADAAHRVAERGIARVHRDWAALADVPPPSDFDFDAHPYARDLDIFGHASVTKWLGAPATLSGRDALFRWLLASGSVEEVLGRQAAVAALAARAEWRETLAAKGLLGQPRAVELDRFIEWAESTTRVLPPWVSPLAAALTLSIWLLIALHATHVLSSGWWTLPLLAGIVLSFACARSMYAVFDRASMGQRTLPHYSSMLQLACDERWSAPELGRLQAELRVDGDAPRLVKRLSRLVDLSELRTAAAVLHFPIQALTLWDFHVFFAIERWQRAHGQRIRAWLSALGQIDALSVLAAIRYDAAEWATPAISAGEAAVDAAALGHPLIRDDRRVANDVTIGPPSTLLLITGSNMSGKSTLLRAIGVNCVLAQAGAPVCAASFSMPLCELQTSIRVQDSLELGLSYFMAALARLKAIVDAAERDRRSGPVLLYLLDEVLQGTNSAERAVAVRAVAQHLLDAGAIGAMTTHDLGLAQEPPFATHARMVHFSEQVHEDGTMTFDYRLRPGLATSRNALRLMQLIGIAPR